MNSLDGLNPMQMKAVTHTEGPLLILAGAGSGKTRALTHRVAYLIEEKDVSPWNILAITFTNKAAEEMRERIDGLVPDISDSIWVSTFHSMCVRILRRHIDNLGYTSSFSIYDTDDSKTLMKQIFRSENVNEGKFKERNVLRKISTLKNAYISPKEFSDQCRAEGNTGNETMAHLYEVYEKELKENNALDFDDLLVKTVELFEKFPEILGYYQDRFRYIMVDEYQDTNAVQFKLVSLLAAKYKNICVVGDDDQSIYRFRGADIRNILSFEETFPGAKVIKLEQNYRSTQMILDGANAVIRNNPGRKDKTLWTDNGTGDKIRFELYNTAYDEAEGIITAIMRGGGAYSDYAVLYRTNSQSRLLEEKCVAYGVPYRIVGGVNFYQRKEIKDILAYLKTIANGMDDIASRRVINVPKRGIGAATVDKVTAFAAANGMSFYEALREARIIPGIGKAASKIAGFTDEIDELRTMVKEGTPIEDLIETIVDDTGYRDELEKEGEMEAETRLENIGELINKAVLYWENADDPSLEEFLEEVSLVADIDAMDDSENRVLLMTLHSAKGLEFPYVYMSGMEENLFPSSISISDGEAAIEEERRLCYVGITRAERKLTLTAARQRMIQGDKFENAVSRFVREIPETLLEIHEQGGSGYSGYRALKKPEFSSDNESGFHRSERTSAKPAYEAAKPSAKPAYEATKPSAKPAFGKEFTVTKAESLDYDVGDRVRHFRFGDGTVMEIKDGGKDYEITVEFDGVGVRKMFASFAKLTKL